MASRFRMPRRSSVIELFLLVVLLTFFIYILSSSATFLNTTQSEPSQEQAKNTLLCAHLPGADDVVVVLKTSAAEAEDKLPIHFDTTLRCYSNHLVLSDYKETLHGHQIHDVLENVTPALRDTHPDFELWRRLQRGGPNVLEDEEIWNADQTASALDKWKWLPMIVRTFHEHPHKKWYVFLQTDTFIFWANLLRWLGTLDRTKPCYIGSVDRQSTTTKSIHSGAGIIFSHSAMKALVALIHTNQSAREERTLYHATGSSILAELLLQAQIPPTDAWPILQHNRMAALDYTEILHDRRLWCYPIVSYSNMSVSNIAEMWKFEQGWTNEHQDLVIRHRDVFETFVMPRLIMRSGRVDDWDNFSNSSAQRVESIDHCQDLCVEEPDCVQVSFSGGTCRLSSIPKMGEYTRNVESRWLLARAQAFADRMEQCTGSESWISK